MYDVFQDQMGQVTVFLSKPYETSSFQTSPTEPAQALVAPDEFKNPSTFLFAP